MTPVQKLVGWLVLAGLLIAAGGASAWKVQDWRYGQQLAEQARSHGETLNQLTLAAATQQRTEQDKRLALEQRLATADQSHHQELINVQKDQVRLRDRLATADLRLSVLVDAADTASCSNVPAATATSGLVHGAPCARLDPAHAQRIVRITDDGDQGLIALAACQAYVRALTR
ncbi:lysozyme [Pseudomonas chlororaphis]|uniref:lysis system i-spanin subunit Rz n=1 Tax=Pseudomonas chlororaphis TaxID=587753 RepID=UPI0004AC0AB0|nr:lysis system i-spanin subunit Rz [Pseudomonas chlororaphis]AIC20559.1 lysozyme [Pseudomonas chlororaphis]